MADNRHMLALGDYRFSLGVAEYESIRRTISLNWVKTDIISRRPTQQFAGVGEESLNITGTVFNYRQNSASGDSPITATGMDQISQIRREALKSRPMRLTVDTGESLGYWVLVNVSETQSHFLHSAPLKQEFDLQLSFFGDRP